MDKLFIRVCIAVLCFCPIAGHGWAAGHSSVQNQALSERARWMQQIIASKDASGQPGIQTLYQNTQPFKNYTGSGNTAVHKALSLAKEAVRDASNENFMWGLDLLKELLEDLERAYNSRSIEKLMDVWEKRYPSGFVDVLIDDLPSLIPYIRELHLEAEARLRDKYEILDSRGKPVFTSNQLHSETFVRHHLHDAIPHDHDKETIVPVYLDSSLSEKIGPRVALFQFRKGKLPILSQIIRKMRFRFPLHVHRNVLFRVDGQLKRSETYVIAPTDMVSASDWGAPFNLEDIFSNILKSDYMHHLKTLFSEEAAAALEGYHENIRDIIAGVAIGELDPIFQWNALALMGKDASSIISLHEIASAKRAIAAWVLFQAGASPTSIAGVIDGRVFDWRHVEKSVRQWNSYYATKIAAFIFEHDLAPAARSFDSIVGEAGEETHFSDSASILTKILTREDQERMALIFKQGGSPRSNAKLLKMSRDEYDAWHSRYYRKIYAHFIGLRSA